MLSDMLRILTPSDARRFVSAAMALRLVFMPKRPEKRMERILDEAD